ncbi:hypothetical protein [Pararhodospirillum photometricum]|uniref:Uncharacterized protein n=1 Tax=Pararhodospirillum photometricum DSM 122 TaxID=1150469 RepID=H6SS60_PARPM|nr:hypothetical protein [Pararhodospirillum photometricum]CCG07739.1 Putative uncharacterized protein [Pararhodospirillum photometricum DSM 122]
MPDAAPRLPGAALEGDAVAWSAPEPITAQTPVRVVTEVPVSVLATAEAFVVGLDFGAAALRLSDRLPGLATTSAPLAAVPALDARGQIARLDRRAGPDPTLVPAGVSTRIVPTKDGRAAFQILTGPTAGGSLAAAGGAALVPAAASAQGGEPAPGIAVQVSSQATMDMIARAYNQGTGVIKILAVPPADPHPHWFLQVHEPMVFEGTFGSADGQVYVRDHARQFLCFAGSSDQDLKLFTVIDPTSTVRLQLDLAAHYPTEINDGVALSEGGQSVTGEGFYESIVRPQLEAFLVGDIRADMTRVRLTPLNDLLLQRLTLPGHTVHLEDAALPGETLVLGSVRPTA